MEGYFTAMFPVVFLAFFLGALTWQAYKLGRICGGIGGFLILIAVSGYRYFHPMVVLLGVSIGFLLYLVGVDRNFKKLTKELNSLKQQLAAMQGDAVEDHK